MDKEEKMNKENHKKHRLAITSVPHKVWQMLGDYATNNAFASRSSAALFILNQALEKYFLENRV